MNKLKQKVEQAKREIGYKSLSKMSYDLGFHYNYLSNTLSEGCTTKTESKIIAKIDALIEQNKQELTHDFKGKALNRKIDDAVMISKSEYDEMYSKNTALCVEVGQLKKEIDHKTQIAEKHADMRNKAELRVSELEKECSEKETAIKQQLLNSGNQVYKINELENKIQSLQKDFLNSDKEVGNLKEKLHLSEQDCEKWQCDYWVVSRENTDLTNSKRAISIWLAIAILVIVAMVAFGVLHFNGVV